MGVLKKYLGLFGFCLGLLNLGAQTAFNVAYHDKSEMAGFSTACFLRIHNDYYYSTLKTDAEYFYTSYLYKHSNGGQLKFRNSNFIPFLPYKLIKTLDNKLLFVGSEITCDVLPAHPRNFICKIDTNGTVLFTNSYAENQLLECKNVVQHTDSSYYAFADSIMYHYDKTGQLILRKNIGLRQISSVLLYPNSNIVISATSNSVNSVCQMNNLGIVTSTSSVPTLFSKMEYYYGSEIFGLGMDNKIHKISNSFTSFANSNFNSSILLRDFTVSNDTLYCVSSSTLETYFISDSTFNTIYTSSTASNGFKQKAILKNQNRVSVLTEGLSRVSSGHNYVTLNVFNANSSNNFDNDVEVLSVVADSSYALVSIPTNSFAPNHYTVFLRAKVKVKNKSAFVLNNFKLNCYLRPDVACGVFYYQEKFISQSLNSGDSLEVMTTFLQNTTYSFGPVQAMISKSFCIFATVPNGMADKDYEDNELCKTFNFQVNDVSVKENSRSENSLIISPNPFNSSLQIKSSTEIKNIDIQNCLGQKVKSLIVNGNQIYLNLSEFSPGIYFVKVETEKGIQLKKVIKN